MTKSTVIFDMHLTLFRFAVSKAGQDLNNSNSQIEPMPNALDVFLWFYEQGFKIVIISASDIQVSRDRLRYLLQDRVTQNELNTLIKEIDILSMQFYGSKHTIEAWAEAMKPYANIDYIFEDGEAKLHAAGEAARQLHSDPTLFTSVAEFWQSQETI